MKKFTKWESYLANKLAVLTVTGLAIISIIMHHHELDILIIPSAAVCAGIGVAAFYTMK